MKKIHFGHINRGDYDWTDEALENLSDLSNVKTIGRLLIICWKCCSIEGRMTQRHILWKCSTLSLIQLDRMDLHAVVVYVCLIHPGLAPLLTITFSPLITFVLFSP